jgi:hypothetical protein
MFLQGLIIGMSNYVNVEIVFREFEIKDVVLAEVDSFASLSLLSGCGMRVVGYDTGRN